MSKKRKLNSKNPKYWDEGQLNEPTIKIRKFGCNAPIRDANGRIATNKTATISGVWYE